MPPRAEETPRTKCGEGCCFGRCENSWGFQIVRARDFFVELGHKTVRIDVPFCIGQSLADTFFKIRWQIAGAFVLIEFDTVGMAFEGVGFASRIDGRINVAIKSSALFSIDIGTLTFGKSKK